MNRFQNNVISQTMRDAVNIANYLLEPTSPMMQDLALKNDFKYNSGTGIQVVEKLLKEKPLLKIQTYRPWYRWSSAIASYSNGVVSFNVYKIESLDAVDMAGTLVHEYCHHSGLSHSNNYKTKDKSLYSVPYYCSDNIINWL